MAFADDTGVGVAITLCEGRVGARSHSRLNPTDFCGRVVVAIESVTGIILCRPSKAGLRSVILGTRKDRSGMVASDLVSTLSCSTAPSTTDCIESRGSQRMN